jgi:membrane-associated phospholipid phosphatase
MIKKYGLALLLLSSSLMNQADSNFTRIRRAQRRINAKVMRVNAAESRSNQALGLQPTNGDEQRYADKRASFGKALPHDPATGLFEVSAFTKMVYALQTGNSNDFLNIPMGTNPTSWQLHDPQASLAFNFVGNDGWIYSLPAPPALTSAEMAADMVEDYWMALMRDVFFNDYDTNGTADMAIADLNTLSDFKGPKIDGSVTAATLFRGLTAGDLVGPYISQFLYLGVPYGPGANTGGTTPGISFQAQVVPQTINANYFMTTVTEWFTVQNGGNPSSSIQFTAPTDVGRLFIRNGQDLGSYAHQDSPPAPYINAALILLAYGSSALDPNNPYLDNPTQKSFVTYNNPDLFYLLSMAAEIALRAAWYFKWQVHRKLRPEVVGFYVNQQITGVQDFGLNSELINSAALPLILSNFGTYLLPMAYPEGAPAHPSYPAGHATVAGTCATILKAFFNEDFVIPNAIEPNPGNTALIPYNTTSLRVGNELNKLASNIALGRDFAGVHYRSDATASLLLGEQIALALLEDEAFCRNISFKGYTLTKFDGTTITVGAKRPFPQY